MDTPKVSSEDAFCRICRSSEGGQLLIFGVSGAERSIPDKIHECLPIKVSLKDGLPQTVCSDCHTKLESFARFRQLSRQTESHLAGLCSTDSDGSNSKNSGTESQEKGSVDSVKRNYALLSEPHPEDYVLMKEETINVDNTYKTSNLMADYLIEFNNNNKVKAENDMVDRDIVLAMRRRREILPPMWDVFERVQSEQERQLDGKSKGGKQALRTVLKGKFSVIHRRYIVAKGSFPCSLCGRCFRFNQGHARDGDTGDGSDMDSSEGMLSCGQCGHLSQHIEELQRHELTHTQLSAESPSGAVPPCTVCNKSFSRMEHLTRHMLTHTAQRPFKCETCLKIFSRKEHLVRHRATHTECGDTIDEKPFVCDICKTAYVRREHMVKHKKMVHNIEEPELEPKPYVCDHCLKTFTRKEHLVRHKKIHLRDIPVTVNAPQVIKQVGTDTVTLEISAHGAGSGKSSDLITSMIEQGVPGCYGQVSIERKPGPGDQAAAAPEAFYPPEGLTDEQRAQLEGFLDSSIVEPEMLAFEQDARDSLEALSVTRNTPIDMEYMEEKESIDLEDLKRMPKCRICAKAFTKKNHLNRHLKRYHNLTKEQVNSGKFEMYENGEITRGEGGDEAAAMEQEDFLDDDGSPILKRPKCSFPCSVCRKTFTRKYHMYRHQKTQHGIEFPSRDQQKDEVKCGDCSMLFLSQDDLNAHECVEEPEEREPARRKPASAGGTFKCAICKSSFESHEGFKEHECKKLPNHRCATCGETFDKARVLAKHMESHGATSAAAATATAAVATASI